MVRWGALCESPSSRATPCRHRRDPRPPDSCGGLPAKRRSARRGQEKATYIIQIEEDLMSSAAGKVPAPGQAIYSASKHALNGYFASLHSELSLTHDDGRLSRDIHLLQIRNESPTFRLVLFLIGPDRRKWSLGPLGGAGVPHRRGRWRPTHVRTEVVGGAGVQFRHRMRAKWFDMPIMDSCGDWKSKWFTIGNHAMTCPEKDGWYPKVHDNWNSRPSVVEAEDVPALLKRVQYLKEQGLTGVGIAFSFMKRRVQPLREIIHFGFQYEGIVDPSRMVPEDISDETVLMRLNKMFTGVHEKTVIVGELSSGQPLVEMEPKEMFAPEEWEDLAKSSSERTLSDKVVGAASDEEIVEDSDVSAPPQVITATAPDVSTSARRKRSTRSQLTRVDDVVPSDDPSKRIKLSHRLTTPQGSSSSSGLGSTFSGSTTSSKRIKPLLKFQFQPLKAPEPSNESLKEAIVEAVKHEGTDEMATVEANIDNPPAPQLEATTITPTESTAQGDTEASRHMVISSSNEQAKISSESCLPQGTAPMFPAGSVEGVESSAKALNVDESSLNKGEEI